MLKYLSTEGGGGIWLERKRTENERALRMFRRSLRRGSEPTRESVRRSWGLEVKDALFPAPE